MAQQLAIKDALELIAQKVRLVKRTDGGEWLFKCPFCGDSENPYHAHLYISEESGLMNCFRCETRGSINRLLAYIYDTKYKTKIDASAVVRHAATGLDTGGIRKGVTAFEDYMHDVQAMMDYNDSFDIDVSMRSYPEEFGYKHEYMEKRTIRDSASKALLYRSNLMQKLYTYYSEYFMQKLIAEGAVTPKTIRYANEFVTDTNTSILFVGMNKTLNIFKTESENSKYIKFKRNIYTGNDSMGDFFTIVNMRKHRSPSDIYMQDKLNVYFAEGVFDAINLYLYNPKYVTDVEPDLIVATGSKVSYPSSLFFILDTFMKPVISHCFLDPDINPSAFKEKYRRLKNFYEGAAYYKNMQGCDYGDISVTDMKGLRNC